MPLGLLHVPPVPQHSTRRLRLPLRPPPTRAMLQDHDSAAEPVRLSSSTAHHSPRRRRRDWEWECPGCGTKHPTGPRMLLHMHKCCGDLLPSSCDLPHIHSLLTHDQPHSGGPKHHQQQQQQDGHAQQPAEQQQHPQGNSGSSGELQQLLEAARQQEHTLRMRALRLRFIDDSPQQAAAAAAEAEDTKDEDYQQASAAGHHADSRGGQQHAPAADATQQQRHLPVEPLTEHGDAVSAAAAAALSEAAGASDAAAGGASSNRNSSSSSSQAVGKKRGRLRSSGRTPVRSIEQVMQELQLPKARVLRLLERAPRSIRLVADSEPLEVVFEDDRFLAVSKPPGLRSAPVHRFMGGSAVNRMIGYLAGSTPYLLHRLDMDTSGVLVAAKDATTAGLVNAQFQAKQVSKAYLALCLGTPQQQQFTIDGPIGQHPGVQVARMVHPDGQPAITHVQVLAVSTVCPQEGSDAWGPAAAADPAGRVSGAGCCLVCCRPVTGRTHQIRVHMAHAGHPLLGDDVYGLQGPLISRQALHAAALTLQDPQSLEPLTFVAAPPNDFVAAAAALDLHIPQDLRALAC